MGFWDRLGDAVSGIGDAVGGALSKSFNYVASGEILTDAQDLAVRAGDYVASGDILDDAATVLQKTGETLSYVAQNPGHAAFVALEGIEEGIGSATGLVVGGVSDVFNAGVKGVSYLATGEQYQLYEGGFGTGIHSVNQFVTQGIDSVEAAVGIGEPVLQNEYDRYIFGATKGVTEVGATIAVVAATGGAGALLVGGDAMAVTGGILAGSVNTGFAATLTGAGTLYAMGADINDQLELRDAEIKQLNALLPGLLESALPAPRAGM